MSAASEMETTAESSYLETDGGEEESMQEESETQEISPSDQEDSKIELFVPNQAGGNSSAGESQMEGSEEEEEEEEEDESEAPNLSEDEESETGKSDMETGTGRPNTAVTSEEEDEETSAGEEEEEENENTENEDPAPPNVPPTKTNLPPKKLASKAYAPLGRSRGRPRIPASNKQNPQPAPPSPKATRTKPTAPARKPGPSSKTTAAAPAKSAAKAVRKPSPKPPSPKQPPAAKKPTEKSKITLPQPPRRAGGKQLVTIGKNPALMEESFEKKKKKRKKELTYHKYIFAAFRQVYPAVSDNPHTVSTASMGIVNSMMNDMFERLATEAARLARMNKSKTLGSREIRTAAMLILPGQLRMHAVAEGDRALHRYNRSETERKNAKEANEAGDKEREKQGRGVLHKKGG